MSILYNNNIYWRHKSKDMGICPPSPLLISTICFIRYEYHRNLRAEEDVCRGGEGVVADN